MVVPRAARASLSGAFRAGSGKEGGVGRIGGRAAVAAGGAGGGGGADRNGGRPDVERRARSRGSRVSSKPRAAAEFWMVRASAVTMAAEMAAEWKV